MICFGSVILSKRVRRVREAEWKRHDIISSNGTPFPFRESTKTMWGEDALDARRINT